MSHCAGVASRAKRRARRAVVELCTRERRRGDSGALGAEGRRGAPAPPGHARVVGTRHGVANHIAGCAREAAASARSGQVWSGHQYSMRLIAA